MNTPCQNSPLGLALLARSPVRLWVTVGTGAKGFSGLPNQNPAFNVPGSQNVWTELQQKPRVNHSQHCFFSALNNQREGSWHQFTSLCAHNSLFAVTVMTNPHLLWHLPGSEPLGQPQPAAAALWAAQEKMFFLELRTEAVSWSDKLWAVEVPPRGH